MSELKRNYVIPGLGREALGYARALLTALPKTQFLKGLLSEPSQEEQIRGLAKRIAATDRRVLIVMDDLDRLQSTELETVFKVLRGSDAFVNVMFVCCFDRTELVSILKSTRPYQDGELFIEKFFQRTFPLPEIDSVHLRGLFERQIETVVRRCDLWSTDFPKAIEEFWEKGGASYFQNLRRIKLFVSRVEHSLERVGAEVNVQDFLKLELVRDIAPSIYDTIYKNPEYFYSDLAFEVRFTSKLFLDDKHAKQRRAKFFDEMIAALPGDKHDAAQVLEGLFPSFAEYRGRFGGRSVDEAKAEKDKRIFHPRFFRQYFLLKVPSELFSQKEFNAFQSSIRSATEDEVKRKTSEMARSLEQEDFKRWHFVHRIETVFEGFNATTKRGLCRGLVANSQLWSDTRHFAERSPPTSGDFALRMMQQTEPKNYSNGEKQNGTREKHLIRQIDYKGIHSMKVTLRAFPDCWQDSGPVRS